MKGFASLAQPMTRLTGKDVKFTWAEECEECFSALKNMLTSAPVLVLPEADRSGNLKYEKVEELIVSEA